MADRMGTPYLQKVLNQQLSNHIRETLPGKFVQNRESLKIKNIVSNIVTFGAFFVSAYLYFLHEISP